MKPKLIPTLLIFFVAGLLNFAAQIDSQWRGPFRTGIYPGEKLLKTWPVSGPELLWSVNGLGQGYSSPAVTKDRVYINGMIDGKGYIFAYDLKGKLLWKSHYGPEWAGGRPGTRTSPTVVGDLIYLFSGEGNAVCLDSKGKLKWKVNTVEKYGARNLSWGFAESPLIDGNRMFCTPGGPDVMIAVLDRFSGKTTKVIKGNGEKSAYCSPVIVKHGKRRLLLTMTGRSLIGLDADTLEFLWSMPHRTSYDINPNTPLYHKGFIYSVSGYGTGGQMFKLSDDGSKIYLVWTDTKLDSQMGASILVNGYIYGSGHKRTGWHCLDWKTGKVMFTAKELGKKGNIIFADGLLYCYSERGDVGLVNPNPGKLDIISSFKMTAGSGEHWAHPVIKNGRLYLRHGDVILVYNITR